MKDRMANSVDTDGTALSHRDLLGFIYVVLIARRAGLTRTLGSYLGPIRLQLYVYSTCC